MGLLWIDWIIDPTAATSSIVPLVITVLLAVNIPLTWSQPRLKRALVLLLQSHVLNPPIRLLLRLGVMPLGYALLETRGRVTGQPRTTPVGNGWHDGAFWIVAEHGTQAGYVRNIARDPRVRVRLRRGWRFIWLTGIAQILPHDDPLRRQRILSLWHPLRALNATQVRILV
ncbi:MAG TPA: nitroreductase/quinone reductase family protein [Pseudonocardiaceae bacterium]